MPIVFSKLANSQKYARYARPVDGADGQINTVQDYVHIKGGAGLADKHLQTPHGVATIITDEEAAALKKDSVFLVHERLGHVKIDYHAKETDVERVVADMSEKVDDSAPLTPSDFQDNDGVIGDGHNGKPTASTTNGGRAGNGRNR